MSTEISRIVSDVGFDQESKGNKVSSTLVVYEDSVCIAPIESQFYQFHFFQVIILFIFLEH